MSGFGGAVKLTGESEYKKALSSITQNLKEVDSELKLVTSQFDKNDKSEQALTAQTETLTKKYDAQDKKVKLLTNELASMEVEQEKQVKAHKELGESLDKEKKKLEEIEKESGKNSQAYKDQAKVVSDLVTNYKKSDEALEKNEKTISETRIALYKAQTDFNKTAKEVDNLGKETDETSKSNENLGKSFDNAGKQAKDSASNGVSAFTVAIGNLVSSAITGAINKLKELGQVAKDAFAEFDEGRDSIIFATGATGEEAESLKKSYENVAGSVVANMNDIGKVVGEVSTRFGFTEKELEDASEAFLKFSKVTGMDAKTAVQSVSRAMEKTGMTGKDYNTMLNMLLTASQKSGVAVDRLADSVTKYAVPMKSLGFDTKNTIAIFAQFEKSGVNVEQAFNGLQKASAKWAKDGKNASEEFEALMKEIKGAPTDIEASKKAIEVFGTKTGEELASAIRSGKMEYTDMLDYISNSRGRLESTFEGSIDATDKLKLAWQKMRLKLAEVVEKIVDKYSPDIEKALDKIVPAVENFIDKVVPEIVEKIKWFIDNLPMIKSILAGIVTTMGGLWVTQKIMAIAKAFGLFTTATEAQTVAQNGLNVAMKANIIGIVISLIAGLIVALTALYKNCKSFRDFIDNTWSKIKEGAQITWNFLKNLFTVVIPEALYNLGETIVTKASEVLEFIGTIPMKIGEFLGEILFEITSFVFDVLESIGTIPMKIGEFIGKTLYNVDQFIKNMASKAWEAGSKFISNIMSFFVNLPWKIWQKLDSALTNVKNFAVDIAKKGLDAGRDFFNNMWNEIKELPYKMIKIGEALISGLWGGIKNSFNWLKNRVSDFCGSVVGFFKSGFGIFSPSHVMRDLVGKNLALGIGEGFTEEMKAVSEDMINAVPTSFNAPEVSGGASLAGGGSLSYTDLVNALREALEGVNVEMDNVTMGRFVKKTVTQAIYT